MRVGGSTRSSLTYQKREEGLMYHIGGERGSSARKRPGVRYRCMEGNCSAR